jgi:hypothetical protein
VPTRWIPITVADIQDQKLAPLVAALRTRALEASPPQTDPTPRLTQAVVDYIRRKIASCHNNRLDVDTTKIPASLKLLAVELIYVEMKGRLEEALTPDEDRKARLAETNLNRIASCEDTIEQPDDPIEPPVEASSGTPSITCGRRERLNRSKGIG